MTTRMPPPNHEPKRRRSTGRVSRPGAPSAGDSSRHGPSSTTRPASSTTTRSAWASAADLLVAPITAAPRARSACHSSISVVASSADETSSASSRSASAGQRAGQREALHLPAGEAYAAVPDERVGAAGLGDVAPHAGGLERRHDRAVRVVEGDVAGERAGQHPRHLRDVGDPRRAQGGLRVVDDLVVPADVAGAAHQPGQRAEQAGLAGADLAEQQHQLAGAAPRGRRPGRRACRRRARRRGRAGPACAAGRGRGRPGRRPCRATRSTPGGRSIRSPPPASAAGGVHPGADARRLGDHRAGDAAEPVEAADGVGDEQRGRQAPLTAEQPAPRRDDAALDHHDRHAVEQRLHAVLAHGGVDAAAVDLAQVGVDLRGRRGELDRADRLEGGHQRLAEAGPARWTRRPPSDRRPGGRASRRAPRPTITASRIAPASQVPAMSAVSAATMQPVDEVDPAVGVAREPVGVHGAGHDLARRRAHESAAASVWPCSTAARTRSRTSTHQWG